MEKPTPEEVRTLANSNGLAIEPKDIEFLVEYVGRMVDAAEAVADQSTPDSSGSREWTAENRGRYGEIARRCSIEPTDAGALDGMDVALKDNIALAGIPMDCGSRVLSGFVPTSDAEIVRRIRGAGGTIVAKTAMDELAASPWGTAPTFEGYVANPHDPDRIAGGSSGGSAAAVAAGVADLAFGTDTGGSIRIPASFCGVIGLKPTWGLLPLSGVLELAYTLDHVGPMARDIESIARALDAVAQPIDHTDRFAGSSAQPYTDRLETAIDPSTVTIGRIGTDRQDRIDSRVRETMDHVIETCESKGVHVMDATVEGIGPDEAIRRTINNCEFAAAWENEWVAYGRHEGPPGGLTAFLESSGDEELAEVGTYVSGKILAGSFVNGRAQGGDYLRAQQARGRLAAELNGLLERFDALFSPTVPMLPPTFENVRDSGLNYTRFTQIANLTRHPAITIPVGTVGGLPVGGQLIGDRFQEGKLLQIADIMLDTDRFVAE